LELCARKTLGVSENASQADIKRAWRRKCLETHPDRNPSDPDAHRRFRMVNCAYQLLTEGTLCHELVSESKDTMDWSGDGKYNLANSWGFYLWWRDTFSDPWAP